MAIQKSDQFKVPDYDTLKNRLLSHGLPENCFSYIGSICGEYKPIFWLCETLEFSQQQGHLKAKISQKKAKKIFSSFFEEKEEGKATFEALYKEFKCFGEYQGRDDDDMSKL